MATNLGIDEKLLAKAHELGGRKTKRQTVNDALAEYVRRRQKLKVLELFGTIDDEGDDHKAQRRRDRGPRRDRSGG